MCVVFVVVVFSFSFHFCLLSLCCQLPSVVCCLFIQINSSVIFSRRRSVALTSDSVWLPKAQVVVVVFVVVKVLSNVVFQRHVNSHTHKLTQKVLTAWAVQPCLSTHFLAIPVFHFVYIKSHNELLHDYRYSYI